MKKGGLKMWEFIKEGLAYLGASTIGSLVIGQFIKVGISNKFQKNLEEYKQSLNKEIEALKHEQSKIYKDFELFTVKKHEYYPELYKLIELSVGKVRGLRGLSRQLDYMNVNKEDIEGYMNDKLFTSEDRQIILDLWDNQRGEAIKRLKHRLTRIDYNEAEEAFFKANDFHLLNALYFSEDVVNTSAKLLSKINLLWLNYDPDYQLTGDVAFIQEIRQENKTLIQDMDELRKELKEKMRKELSN